MWAETMFKISGNFFCCCSKINCKGCLNSNIYIWKVNNKYSRFIYYLHTNHYMNTMFIMKYNLFYMTLKVNIRQLCYRYKCPSMIRKSWNYFIKSIKQEATLIKCLKKILPRKYLHYYLFTKISKINCSKDFV